MNNLVITSLAALVCSLGTSTLYAGSGGNPPPSHNWGNCTSLGCEKDIPIKLEVPKKCEVNGGSAIVLNKDGGPRTSNYTIRSNTHYVLNIQTANAGILPNTYVKHDDDATVRVPTTIITNKSGGGIVPWGDSNHMGLTDDEYTVSVNNSAVGAFQRAGTYRDTYRIRVFY